MATLHVREIPDKTYNRIKKLAVGTRRSLSAQVAILLDLGLQQEEHLRNQEEVLASISRRRAAKTASTDGTSLDLLREDRARAQ